MLNGRFNIKMGLEYSGIFIDGGYVNKCLKNYFNKESIDYLKLSNWVCKINNLKRLRTYFYDCLPIIRANNEQDKRLMAGKQAFLDKLKRLSKFEVKLGQLQLIGNFFKQKMIDVLMSLDIVEMCFNKHIKHVILFAGDADFIPAIKKAKDNGAIVHLYYYPKAAHNSLLDEVDELHEITEELINECKIV